MKFFAVSALVVAAAAAPAAYAPPPTAAYPVPGHPGAPSGGSEPKPGVPGVPGVPGFPKPHGDDKGSLINLPINANTGIPIKASDIDIGKDILNSKGNHGAGGDHPKPSGSGKPGYTRSLAKTPINANTCIVINLKNINAVKGIGNSKDKRGEDHGVYAPTNLLDCAFMNIEDVNVLTDILDKGGKGDDYSAPSPHPSTPSPEPEYTAPKPPSSKPEYNVPRSAVFAPGTANSLVSIKLEDINAIKNILNHYNKREVGSLVAAPAKANNVVAVDAEHINVIKNILNHYNSRNFGSLVHAPVEATTVVPVEAHNIHAVEDIGNRY